MIGAYVALLVEVALSVPHLRVEDQLLMLPLIGGEPASLLLELSLALSSDHDGFLSMSWMQIRGIGCCCAILPDEGGSQIFHRLLTHVYLVLSKFDRFIPKDLGGSVVNLRALDPWLHWLFERP